MSYLSDEKIMLIFKRYSVKSHLDFHGFLLACREFEKLAQLKNEAKEIIRDERLMEISDIESDLINNPKSKFKISDLIEKTHTFLKK